MSSAHGRYAIKGDGFGKVGLPENVGKGSASMPICEKRALGPPAGWAERLLHWIAYRIGKAIDERFWTLRVEKCVCPKNE